MAASYEERIKMFNTAAKTRHEDRVSIKMKIINEERDLKKNGLSNCGISRKTGLSTVIVSRYLDECFAPVHSAYGIKRTGILSKFQKDLDLLLDQGVMASKIEEKTREKGYDRSSSTVRHYVSEWKKIQEQYIRK